jgi:hypothetical protein
VHGFCFSFTFMGGRYQSENCGLKLLVEKYRKEFEIPENLNFYSEENYKITERKFLKYALGMGGIKDLPESTTSRKAGGLDFTAIGGKRQGREVPQSLRVEPGAKHPVWKTQ